MKAAYTGRDGVRQTRRWLIAALLVVTTMLVYAGTANAMTGEGSSSSTAPWIISDQTDYTPGSTVHLTGGNWNAGESVQIVTNDSVGNTWSQTDNVTADDNGNIADDVVLPNTFVANYTVTATGAQSGVATTTFTDGNIKVKSAGGVNFGFTFQGFTGSTNCSTGGGTTSNGTGDTNGENISSKAGDSVLITANLNANSPNSTATFSSWSNPNGATLTVGTLTSRTICVAGFDNGSKDLIGNYTVNTAPTVAKDNASSTVNEGQTATNTGTFSDAQAADSVTITASVGTVTQIGSNSGTWSWSFVTNDGPAQSQTVTITATDNHGASSTTTFPLTVNNVAPTATFPATRTVNEGISSNFAFTSPSDPSTADTSATFHYAYSCTGASLASATYAGSGTATSVNCTFPDGPASATVRTRIIDKDEGFTEYTTAVTVDNVAPVAVADMFAATEDTQKMLPLSGAGSPAANDTDVPSDPLTVSAVSNPTNGNVQITGGNIVFTPAADFCGTAGFDYTVSDGDGGTATGHVTLNVACVNDPPVAATDTPTTAEDTAKTIDAAGNDSPGPANESTQTLHVDSVGTPSHGTASVIASGPDAGKVLYTPDANYNGPDSFTYQVCDNGTTNGNPDPLCDSGTVNVTVTEVNDPPVAATDTPTTAEDTAKTIDAAGNDSPGPANESTQTLHVDSVGTPSHGTASVIASGPDAGKVLYTPDANYNGPDSFTYQVCDNGTTNGNPDPLCDSGTVNVTVTEVNDPPVAATDTPTTAEDTAKTIDAAGNDSPGPANESTQTLHVDSVGTPSHGTASVIASGPDAGKVLYTPDANYNGPDSFTYQVCDNGTTNGNPDPLCDSGTVNVTMTEVNDPPVAATDTPTTAEDTAKTIDAAGNDSPGPANESTQTLHVDSVGTPSHGTASVIASGPDAGKVLYTPDANYNGPDSFTYQVCDNGTTNGNPDPLCDSGTVNVTVTEVNDPPVAATDTPTTAEDTAKTIDAAGNDSPGPANESTQTLHVDSVGTPSHGTASVIASGPDAGKVLYTPDANYNGPDSFTYQVCDNGTTNGNPDPLCDSGTVNVTVTEVNDPPVAATDTPTTAEDTAKTIDAAGNDSPGPANESTQTLHVDSVGTPSHGTASVIASGPDAGKVLYTPDANYNGPDSFTYQVCDNGTTNGNPDPLCDSGTVNVTVTEVNDPPVAATDTPTTAEDTAKTIDAAGNDSPGPANESTQTLHVDSVGTPSHGTASVIASGPDAGKVLYTPDANYNGPDSFTYQVCDNGTTNGNPDPLCDSGTVNVTVTEVNDPPVAATDTPTTAEDTAKTIDAAGNDSPGPANESTQTLHVDSVGTPSHGTASVIASGPDAGKVLYTPDANYNGPDSFTYQVCDNGTTNGNPDPLCDSGTVNVTVTEVNDPPVAATDTPTTAEDTAKTIDAAGNDSPGPANESTQTLHVDSVGTPSHGTASVIASGPDAGKVLYTPDANYNGPDSFTYQVCDNGTTNGNPDPLCDSGTVNVTVTEVNDPPVAATDTPTTAEDTAKTIDAAGNDSPGPANESTQTLHVDSVGTPSHGTASVIASGPDAGKVLYTPDANYNGPDSFTYQVCDNGTTNGNPDPLCDSGTVNVTVTEVNDPPSFTKGANQSAPEDSGAQTVSNWATNISPGPANESSQTVQFVVTDNSNPGLFAAGPAISPSGTLTYTPAANANGSATIKVKTKDSGGTANGGVDESPEQTFTITVTEVNDAVDAVNDSAAVDEDDSTGVLIDVLANDSKGPANESGQTLTITNVSTPSHGTAVIESGKIRYTPTQANYNGPDSFTYTIRDNGTTNGVDDFKFDTATVSITVRPVNDNPTVAADNANRTIDEGQTATNTGTWGDVDGDAVTLSASRGTVVKNANGTWSWSFATNDGPTQSGPVTITANDGHGGTQSVTFQLTVNNVAPTITALTASSQVIPAGGTSTVTATFTDPGTADTHQTPLGGSCVFDWDSAVGSSPVVTEANGSGNCKSTGTFASPGIYSVTVTITDDDGGSTTSTITMIIAVYDPSAGFVTGGGWINSPAGAYRADPTLSGHANFGFNAKYQKGQSIPTGETEFDFQVGNLNFHSESYDWLVVSGNTTRAQFKGKGTYNGQTGYGFLLTAYDGSPDKFRIKIWNITTSAIVYDNNYSAPDDIDTATPMAISGGSIVIHK